jgi:hypothetical protein
MAFLCVGSVPERLRSVVDSRRLIKAAIAAYAVKNVYLLLVQVLALQFRVSPAVFGTTRLNVMSLRGEKGALDRVSFSHSTLSPPTPQPTPSSFLGASTVP